MANQIPDMHNHWRLSNASTIGDCTTPSKLVVYKPMGAECAADRTIAQLAVPLHSSDVTTKYAMSVNYVDLCDVIRH